jgi:hypothetical protein
MPLILVEIDDRIAHRGYFVMAEEWIDHLAKQIIEKDTDAANEIKRREHRESLIKTHSHSFFKSFAESFKHSSDQLEEILRASAVASQQRCSVTDNDCTLKLERSKLPFVTVSATFQPAAHQMVINYFASNPERPAGNFALNSFGCRFEINEHGKLYAVFDGHDFHTGKDLAEHLVKLLFAV